MTTTQIKLPDKLIPVFTPPRGELRYRGAYGGRGSAKSFTFAKMAAVWGYAEKLRILCTREMQNSIKESFHAELKNAIQSEPWLEAAYDVGADYIRGKNGTEFIFRGLRHNTGSIKSLAQIDLCIVEEAEDVPEASWQVLEPTIRAPKSEIWIIWNPRLKNSPTDQRFIQSTPPRACIAEINHSDNPWFPAELEEQRIHAQKIMDDALYRHVWEGAYYEQSDAQVFRGKYITQDFEAQLEWDGPYIGLDHGFSQDPAAAVRCWVSDNRLYIDYEAGGQGIELDDLAAHCIERIPDIAKHVIRGDSARPDANSYLKRHGLPRIVGCEKGKGSVEDGIQFIRSFEKVVIHPRCKDIINEFRLYSYKVDRLSGDILPVPVDANNHWIDSCIEHGQLISTSKGKVTVQDIRKGDMLLTRKGFNAVNHAWQSGESEPIWCIKTEYAELRATANHLVYVNGKGFVRVDALSYNDEVLIEESLLCELKQQKCSDQYGEGILMPKTDLIGSISQNPSKVAGSSICIEQYGSTITDPYQKNTIFTTLMKIARTTAYRILNALPVKSTQRSTRQNGRECLSTLRKLGRLQKHGTQAMKGLQSTERSEQCHTSTSSLLTKSASTAKTSSKQERSDILIGSAQTNASQRQEGKVESMMLSESADIAALNMCATNTANQRLVPARVLTVYYTGERNRVYDIEVEGAHEFVASGILVHNCRYALEPLMKKRSAPMLSVSMY